MKTLDEIRAETGKRFPVHLLEGARTGLCLFAAEYYGRGDLIHLYDAGLKVDFVDLNAERLGEMFVAYRQARPVVYDAFLLVEEAHAAGARWDIITADPWSQQIRLVLEVMVPDLVDMADRFVVCGYMQDVPTEATVDSVTADLYLLTGRLFDVVEVIQRNQYRGGIYWVVIRGGT